jgi:phage baseplate assembly protein gpV
MEKVNMSGMVEVIRKIVEAEIKKIHVAELGMVTSIFPHASDSDKDNYECNVKLKNTGLELQKVPVATQHIGLAHIPKVDEMVLVTFLNGDINAPILIGRMYTAEDRPPANDGEEIIYVPPYSENADLRRVHMELPSGIVLSVTDDIINVEAGKTTLKINRDGDVELESNAKINITASGDMSFSADTITMESKKDVVINAGAKATLESKSPMSLKGAEVKLEAQGAMSMKGVNVNMESQATMGIKAGATASIEATAPLTLKGAMVNIN